MWRVQRCRPTPQPSCVSAQVVCPGSGSGSGLQYPTNVLQTAGLGAHPLPAPTAGLHAPPPSPLTDFSGFLIPFSKIP